MPSNPAANSSKKMRCRNRISIYNKAAARSGRPSAYGPYEMLKRLKVKASRVCLASNLRAARSLFRWSQEELGLQCGLKRTYIGALERREVNPGIDNLDKLAVGVGVLAHVLLLSPDKAYAEFFFFFSSTAEPAP